MLPEIIDLISTMFVTMILCYICSPHLHFCLLWFGLSIFHFPHIIAHQLYYYNISVVVWDYAIYIFKGFFKKYLFILGKRKGGRKRERETSMCGCLSCALDQGPGPQPRPVPWLGIEPVTLLLAGWYSIHWATPARVQSIFLTYLNSF